MQFLEEHSGFILHYWCLYHNIHMTSDQRDRLYQNMTVVLSESVVCSIIDIVHCLILLVEFDHLHCGDNGC